ncbi:MAG: transposase [Euryarchaeota archaeon]|nr:transposase [Euryarchaeota archaeon]
MNTFGHPLHLLFVRKFLNKIYVSVKTMEVKKTIKAKVVALTKIKKQILDQEYKNLQLFLRGNKGAKLYSANKQQSLRFYKKIKQGKEYPISIRKDLIKIEKQETKIAKYWSRIPVAGRRGGVWVAIKPHCNFENFEICESKLTRKNEKYFLHFAVKKEVEIKHPQNFSKLAIIAIDLGERNPATSVELLDGKMIPRFYGNKIRAIRAHYNNLRKSLGKAKIEKAIRIIKRIGNKEQRIVRDVNHKISREIVNRAVELKNKGYVPAIVLGKLKKIRKPRIKGKTRCRKNNRKINSWAFAQLTKFITYKANWEGIPVELIPENHTSITCHKCGAKGVRIKRLFKCSCGLEYSADLNGAINIANRFLDYMFGTGLFVNQPITKALCSYASIARG